jgi:RNA polymerase sigma-70 factor (ECF subfamily)
LLDSIPRLRRYARSLTYEAAQADDLTQHTLERALSRWTQFDPARDMTVWLLSIAHNAHLDGVRRDARLTVTDPTDLQRAQDAGGGDPGVDVGLRIDLQAALLMLSPEQREPLLLVCVEQLSYAEVASVMNIPVGTVMSRVCRARAALRRFLSGDASTAPAGKRRLLEQAGGSDDPDPSALEPAGTPVLRRVV